MSTDAVTSARKIVITEDDFDRLSEFLGSSQYRTTHPSVLATLWDELDQCEIVEPHEVPKDVVTMRSRVLVRDLGTGETESYTLVYPDEASMQAGKLSVLAPLGTALLGIRAGQVITFRAPAGMRCLKVENVVYQPEAAGDYHL